MTEEKTLNLDDLSKEQLIALLRHHSQAIDHLLEVNNKMLRCFIQADGKPIPMPVEVNEALNRWSIAINDAQAISLAEVNRIVSGAPRGANAQRDKMN